MERLTYKVHANDDVISGEEIHYESEHDGMYMWGVPRKFRGAAIDRLAAYEDTGLTPEKVEILSCSYPKMFDMVDELNEYRDIGTIKHLQKLVKAEQDGRLMVLPCKEGDTVYVIAKCDWVRRSLDGTMYSANGALGTATGYYCAFDGCEDDCPLAVGKDECDQSGYAVFEEMVDYVGASYNSETGMVEPIVITENLIRFLGNKIYLTPEEAEAALAEEEGKTSK